MESTIHPNRQTLASFYDTVGSSREDVVDRLHYVTAEVMDLCQMLMHNFETVENRFPSFMKLQPDEAAQVRAARKLTDLRLSVDRTHLLVLKTVKDLRAVIAFIRVGQKVLEDMCYSPPSDSQAQEGGKDVKVRSRRPPKTQGKKEEPAGDI